MAGKEFECGDDGDHIGELDLERIVSRVTVIIGKSAPAIVEGDHAARVGAFMRECRGQRLEIGSSAGEAGQAHHGHALCAAAAITAGMQAQSVGSGNEDAGDAVLHGVFVASMPSLI